MIIYKTPASIEPAIKKEFLTTQDRKILQKFSFSEVLKSDGLYFCSFDFKYKADSRPLERTLKRIIKRSKGVIPYLYIEGALYCNDLGPGSYRGFACFITKNSVEWMETSDWLIEEIDKIRSIKTQK